MKAIFSIIFFLIFNLGSFAQQNGASIVPEDGIYVICVSNNGKVKLKSKLIIPPNHPGIKKFSITWGNQPPKFFTDINAPIENDIDLTDFVKFCKNDEKFNIEFDGETNDGKPNNSSYNITFKNIPRPDFKNTTACSGKEVSFPNNSCPSSNDIKYLWSYGDGSTADDKGKHTYTQKGNYTLTLTATNFCAASGVSATKTITVIDPAKAVIADSGHVAIRPNPVTNVDTVLYCYGNGAGVIRIDGVAKSEGNPDQFEWRITGGQYKYLEKTDANSPRPKIQLLEKDKIYSIELRVNNACNQVSPWVKCFHVVKDVPALALIHQDDKCEKFTYKPNPFIKEATYKVNGQPLPASGEIVLDIATNRYKIEATLNNLCGNQILKDSFFVAPAQAVSIIAPSQNTSVCSGTAPIPLEANFTDGKWDASPYIKVQNGKNVFVPTDAGTFTITYRRGTGVCQKSDSRTIEVKGLSVKADDKAICSGVTVIKLTANQPGGTWATNDCVNCIKGDSLILTSISKNNLTVEYTVTGTNGCSSKASAQINIGKPKANFELKGGCAEQTRVLKNTSLGATSYVWTVNNIIVNENDVVNSLKKGINIVKLEAKAGACSSDTTITINITVPPRSISFSLNKLSDCSPFTPIISVTDTPEANVTYTWDFGDGKPINQFNPPVYKFQNFGFTTKIFTIKFTAKNDCGTIDATPQNISVNPLAKAEIGIDSTSFRCSPAVVTFTNRSQGANTSTWYFGNNTPVLLTDKIITRTFSADNTNIVNFSIRLEVANTCGTDADTINIQVYPKTMTPFFQISKSIEICPGEKIQFKDASTPKPTQWTWKANGVVFANDSIPKYAFDKENTTYTIRLIARNGCVIDSVDRKVITKSKPKSTFTVGNITACQDTPFLFTNTADPQYLFEWNFGDNQRDTNSFLVKHSYSKSGNYVVKLNIFDKNKSCKDSSLTRISVLEKPIPDFEIDNGTSRLCSPATIKFNDKSLDATEWFWEVGIAKKSTAQNPEFLLDNGQYVVKLTVGNGFCKDSVMSQTLLNIDSCIVYLPQVFTPNKDGIGDYFNIFGKDPMIKLVASLRVFDRWGEVVFDANNLKPNSYTEGWEGNFKGKEMPVGNYPYQTIIQFEDNSTKTFTGVVRLIR